jgi:hypothetical protein
MKKKIYFITTALAALSVLSLSSCLKDPRYVNFGQGGTVVNFPKGGLPNFAADAITDASDTVVKQFAVELASPTVPTSPTDVTIAVDNSIIAAYGATNTAVSYLPMPDGSYTLSATKVTIPAGQRSGVITVTFYRSKIDPTLSYMLPIKIASTTGGGTISGNFGIHYYHFIGNDFAGAYLWDYTRVPASGNFVGHDGIILPVTPSQFEMVSGYYVATERYEVTFTKTGSGAGALYSNWAVDLNSDDITNIFTPAGIVVVQHPKFVMPGFDPNASYTYDQVVHGLLKFNYTTLTRSVTDYYYRP